MSTGSPVESVRRAFALLEELAGKMSFETRPSTNSPGQIEVYTSDGVGGGIARP